MTLLSKSIVTFIFTTILFGSTFSQDTTSTKKQSILITIEDSLRGKLIWKNDSTWINQQLVLQNSILNAPGIYYKLVKIGKRKFTEGPHANFPYIKKKNYDFKYGDSTYFILGKKVYTYIGNSSWGYYYEYQLERLYPSRKLDFKFREPNTCEHGWDQLRGQACYQCLHQYRMQYDSNYRAKDSIKKINTQLIDCAHGHICCDVSWCDCCPEKNRTKSIIKINKLPVMETPVCEHGYDQQLGKACPQCLHQYRMSEDSTLKPYSSYLKKPDSTLPKSIKQDCAHSHDCCSFGCECCPSLTKKERRKLIREKKKRYRINKKKTRKTNQ